MQCFLSEEVALAKGADELFLLGVRLSDRHAHLTLGDDEEGVATCPLTDDVVALLVVALFQHVGNLAQGVLREVFEDRNAARSRNKIVN